MLKQVVFLIILFMLPVFMFSQTTDTATIVQQDSPLVATNLSYNAKLNAFLGRNKLLNISAAPGSAHHTIVSRNDTQAIYFYIIAGMALFLGFFKFFYAKYFNNLFRVFFNTSLRQSQLTDQLLQAKLPSLFFNIFFVLSGGIYVYFLLEHFNWMPHKNKLLTMTTCILAVAVIYFVKFLTLKFTGWLTSYKEPVNTYVFVVFLINKILGIFLLPFIIMMAFSSESIAKPAMLTSLFLIVLFLLLRFIRSYGLLQTRLRVSKLHFFLYIAGIEVIPLLLIYKGLMILLNKNL
ncbi:DUF4271 domain-containing protein [Ferruginibacter sp. SUN002]|uniref:DUF4271 domain-containing protein n=1 Tax=Ferruginibacter sp. SUN002 TaxID=2937789 RepID=UPI003D3610BE